MGFSRHETLQMAIDDRLRGVRLGFEPCPIRKVAVPFDKNRDGSALADDDVEQLPHSVGDRTVMAVDEQKVALVICLSDMAGKVNLTDVLERKIGEIVARGKAVIGS